MNEKKEPVNERTVRLWTSNSLTEAHLIKARLTEAGIDCFLTNEHFTSLLPSHNGILGSGIQIIINEKDHEASSLVIEDILKPEKVDKVCPNCGSKNIDIGYGKRKKLYAPLMFFSIAFGIPLGNLTPNYFCKDCKSDV